MASTLVTCPSQVRRHALCAGTARTLGYRSAFDLEMRRLRRLGLRGERQFRLAALNVFGRAR